MASAKPFLAEGPNSNRPPCFTGDHYDFWKIRMTTYLEAQGEEIWGAVQNGPYVPTTTVNGVTGIKPQISWDDDDRKKVLFDKKAKNILQSSLGMDEFFRISNCKTAKEIWDTLETTHEGTEEVKRSRLNTLSQEYEMFRMQPGENILDMQKRFSHLINHLAALGKTLSNNEINLKILRSLTREWQPKVTAISEKKSLSNMSLAALFGKLQEHELELDRLEKNEGCEHKVRSLALKTKVKNYESEQEDESQSDSEEDDDDDALIKKFKEFLKKEMSKVKNQKEAPKRKVTCFESGERGHIKSECPTLLMKNKFNIKKDKRQKKAYVAWDDNEISSSSDEEANMTLMASHHSDDEENEVSDSELNYKYSYEELQNAFNELYEECINLSKTCAKQKKQIVSLERKAFDAQVELEKVKSSSCNKCKENETKIVELNQVIKNFEKGHNSLEEVLSKQRYSNNKTGLGFSNFNKPSTNKGVFVKASTISNNIETKKMHVVNPSKNVNQRINSKGKNYSNNSFKKNNSNVMNNFSKGNNFGSHYVHNFTCFYCNIKGHTPNNCYIRNIGVPYGEYIWIKKGIDPQGPKENWVPRKFY